MPCSGAAAILSPPPWVLTCAAAHTCRNATHINRHANSHLSPHFRCACRFCLGRGASGHRGGSRVHGRPSTPPRPPRRLHGPRDPAGNHPSYVIGPEQNRNAACRTVGARTAHSGAACPPSPPRRPRRAARPHGCIHLVCHAAARSCFKGPAGGRGPGEPGRRATGLGCTSVEPLAPRPPPR